MHHHHHGHHHHGYHHHRHDDGMGGVFGFIMVLVVLGFVMEAIRVAVIASMLALPALLIPLWLKEDERLTQRLKVSVTIVVLGVWVALMPLAISLLNGDSGADKTEPPAPTPTAIVQQTDSPAP